MHKTFLTRKLLSQKPSYKLKTHNDKLETNRDPRLSDAFGNMKARDGIFFLTQAMLLKLTI